jgi:hypothetical protein
MYIPFGKNIYAYDVNSLYPFTMKTFPMPIGNITFFEGDITKFNPDAFGFFEVEITAPIDLNIPILQTKAKINNNLRTVAPLGTWTDMIFSEEMNNALKFGYKFKILSGYLFEQDYIFTEYINDLYQIKKSHNKNEPMYLISKLLMNSLYGRFGMDYRLYEHIIINNDELYNLIDNYSINEVIELSNNKSLISYLDNKKIESINLDNKSSFNISISVASAITACSRIHMSQFKSINNEFNLYYSDTDSIYIDKPLDDSFISNELGKMKLEYIFDEAVFISPKVYGGVFDNKEIVKIKGFKNKLSFNELKSLLIKDSKLELNHDKWFKDIENGSITIKNQVYTLMSTENKRQLFYNNNNQLINTKSFIIDSNKEIDSK